MHITRAASPQRQAVELLDDGVRRVWLANEAFGRAHAARVSEVTIPSATTYVQEQHDGERVCVLVDGSGELTVAGDGHAIAAGTVVHSRTGGEFTITTGAVEAKILILEATEKQSGGQGRADHEEPAPVTDFSLFGVTDEVLHRPEAGFLHMGTRMLLTAERGGYRSFIFGQSTFSPLTGIHVLHRHRGADEMFYVWEGTGAHLDADGAEHRMTDGDAVLVPSSEWHGFRNLSDRRPVRAFFCLLGAGDMSRAGNEVLENGAPRNVLPDTAQPA